MTSEFIKSIIKIWSLLMIVYLYDSSIKWRFTLTYSSKLRRSDSWSVFLGLIRYLHQFLKFILLVKMETYFYGFVSFRKRAIKTACEEWCWCEILILEFSWRSYMMFMHRLSSEEAYFLGDWRTLRKYFWLGLSWVRGKLPLWPNVRGWGWVDRMSFWRWGFHTPGRIHSSGFFCWSGCVQFQTWTLPLGWARETLGSFSKFYKDLFFYNFNKAI